MSKTGKQANPKQPKAKFGLPDLDHSRSAVLESLRSPESKRGYRHALDEFIGWYCSEPRLSFNKTVVTRYRIHLENRHLAAGTINGPLAAVRSLAYEAADAVLLSPELAAGIRRVKGVKKLGVRLGNWLTAQEARLLWQAPDPEALKGKRDRAILAVLLGCGLRRRELADLGNNILGSHKLGTIAFGVTGWLLALCLVGMLLIPLLKGNDWTNRTLIGGPQFKFYIMGSAKRYRCIVSETVVVGQRSLHCFYFFSSVNSLGVRVRQFRQVNHKTKRSGLMANLFDIGDGVRAVRGQHWRAAIATSDSIVNRYRSNGSNREACISDGKSNLAGAGLWSGISNDQYSTLRQFQLGLHMPALFVRFFPQLLSCTGIPKQDSQSNKFNTKSDVISPVPGILYLCFGFALYGYCYGFLKFHGDRTVSSII